VSLPAVADSNAAQNASLESRARDAAAVAAASADDVDRKARFPQEAVDELARLGLLSASIPVSLGGEGASMVELARAAEILGAACSATGMIFAMHHSQVLSLTRHDAASEGVHAVLARVVSDSILLASATTEIGIGGDTRSSGCAIVEQESGGILLTKTAPVISYGRYAGAILATARRNGNAAPSDQVLVVCPAENTTLDPINEWNTLGFRGTCSPGFELTAKIDRSHVVAEDYGVISAQTMLPVSHILWASVWLGIARVATSKASQTVQASARKSIGTVPPGAQRLAELLIRLQAFSDAVASAAGRFDDLAATPDALGTISVAIAMNGLKIFASQMVVEIVGTALLITGIAGYRLDSEVSLGRLLRDSYGAALMVNNDRILSNNAGLALLYRDSI
jgi:acyl-CoA dehydrogenase